MPDILRNDGRIRRTLPNAYSELMLPVCGGHALWFPRKVANGGGALGDVGYIDDGAFEKLYNVYESPPLGLPALPRPLNGMTLDEQFNMTEMKSSRRSVIELRVSGSNDIASLPLSISPAIIEPRISLQDEKFAYLIPPPPVRKDHLNLNVCDELREWLTVNRHMLREGTIIITKVVRSSGWLGGVATGRKIEASATIGLNLSALGRLDVGASRAYEVTQLGSIQGPDNWTNTDGADYTLIVDFVMARGRFNMFRSRFKLSASTASAAQSAPISEAGIAHGMSVQSRPSTLGAGNLETAPLDDIESYSDTERDPSSSESSESGDTTLLSTLLDHVLIANEDIDVAVSNSSIITDFIAAHGTVPSPPEVIAVFATRSIVTNNNGNPLVEKVAFVDSLQPRETTSERVSGSIPNSAHVRAQSQSPDISPLTSLAGASSASVPLTPDPPTTTRTRLHVACLQCRSRKVRCDGGKPTCDNCIRRSTECKYDAKTTYDSPDKKPGVRQRTDLDVSPQRKKKRRKSEADVAIKPDHGGPGGSIPSPSNLGLSGTIPPLSELDPLQNGATQYFAQYYME